jgi:DNA-binding response OmpR family regulator
MLEKPLILLLEDEDEAARTLAEYLELKGYRLVTARTGREARAAVDREAERLAAAVLDVMVPDGDGYTVCAYIKQHPAASDVPVLFLTAKDREEDEISGIQLGADSYLAKPAGLALIAAYIEALLKKFPRKPSGWLHRGPVWINENTHEVRARAGNLACTPTEFRLLQLFMTQPKRVFDRQEILDLVYGDETNVFERTVDAHIKNLRLKLGSSGDCIKTVRGIGYGWNE